MLKTNLIKNVDYIKGIAILLVCIGHAATPSFLPRPHTYEYVVQAIYSFHMPLFFLISGFLSYKIIDINLKNNYIEFIKKKLYRICIPFLTISFITNLIVITLKILINDPLSTNAILDMIKIIFLYPENGIMGALWFLYTLFIINIISPILVKFPLKIVIILAFLLNIFVPNNIYFLSISRVCFFLVYFLIGIYFRKFYYNSINLKNINIFNKILILCVCIISIIFYSYIVTNEINISKYFINILSFLCGLFGMVIMIAFIKKIESLKISSLLSFLGKHSMDIYILSWFFQVSSMILISSILHISNYNIFFVSNLIIGFLCIPFSLFIIRKFKLLRFLILGEITENNSSLKSELTLNN